MSDAYVILKPEHFRHIRNTVNKSCVETDKGNRLPLAVRTQLTEYLFKHGRSTNDPVWRQRSRNRFNFATVNGQHFTLLEVA